MLDTLRIIQLKFALDCSVISYENIFEIVYTGRMIMKISDGKAHCSFGKVSLKGK